MAQLTRSNPAARFRLLEKLAPLVALIVLVTLLAVLSPTFRTTGNLWTVARQTAVICIIAIGETFVIIAGGIDLSVGSVAALAGAVGALAMLKIPSVPVGILVGMLTGALCGFVNGFITARAQMPSFIATLGMMGIARGAALILSGGNPIFDLPKGFDYLGGGNLLGIPFPVFLTALIAMIAYVVLAYTRLGRYTYAVGGNARAARLSGVNVDRQLIVVFTICGLLAGLAGVVLASRTASAQPTAGRSYELDSIAACVIGGASLMGGEGAVSGTLIGAFLMSVIRNGCNLLAINEYWQQVTIGAIIILAVFYDHLRKRGR
ncbi:MAG: ABC transporter permease [Armatimonadetes bacterium]|nr:ABC transporter permease [Armatimonadota bacterium]